MQGWRVMNEDLGRTVANKTVVNTIIMNPLDQPQDAYHRPGNSRWIPITVMLALVGIVALNTPMTWAIAAPDLALAMRKPAIANAANPSPDVINSLRQALSKHTGLPAKKLRLVEATQTTWADGCLGLGKADEFCSQALVSGWRVVLTNGTRRWIYRTDATAKVYRMEPPSTRTQTPTPTRKSEAFLLKAQIATSELPEKLAKDAVFRAIVSGGFTGRTSQTTLFKDGRIVREWLRPDGTTASPKIHQISAEQVTQFQRYLKDTAFQQFNRQNYPATAGSADFMTVTLSSHRGTVRYADTVQEQLPRNLKSVIATWNDLVANYSDAPVSLEHP
jgi:hypothetical protein